MKTLFENQLNSTQPLTEEILSTLQNKFYFNGEEKLVGEIILSAMLMSDIIESEHEFPELSLKLITLNEKHFNLFEYDKKFVGSIIPTIKLKSKIMKKEIILAGYINIGNILASNVDRFIEKMTERVKIDTDTLKVNWIMIPVRNEVTRVECIYPSYVIVDGQEIVENLQELNKLLEKTSENLLNKSI